MCVARPLGRGNHLEHTEHWCIFDFFCVPDFVRSVLEGCSTAERGEDPAESEGLELRLSLWPSRLEAAAELALSSPDVCIA